MPSRFAASLIISIIVSAVPLQSIPLASSQTATFPDMATSWYRYRESVGYLTNRGVIQGYPDGSFHPKDTINRAEFLKIIFQSRGGRAGVPSKCFSDIDEFSWYAAYVCAAKRRGMISGYPDGTFKPDQAVNIAEALKIAASAYRTDVPEKSGANWYEPYAAEFAKNDIFPRHNYLPWEPLTRERAADLITRIMRHDEDSILPGLSPGCGKARTPPPSTLTVHGVERSFIVDLPTTYVAHDPLPLIVAFHGRTNSNEQVRQYYNLDRSAEDYIVVYPAALRNTPSSFSWVNPGEKGEQMRDIAFFDAIVQTMAEKYCVDMDRIYTVGHSLGAWFANTVACIRGGIVRASGTVGGDSVITNCAGPTAAMLMHNPADTLASFSSTERAYDMRVKENACTPDRDPMATGELNCELHRSCDGGNSVVWCPHEISNDRHGAFYPHQWPDGATDTIVRFFEGLQ